MPVMDISIHLQSTVHTHIYTLMVVAAHQEQLEYLAQGYFDGSWRGFTVFTFTSVEYT